MYLEYSQPCTAQLFSLSVNMYTIQENVDSLHSLACQCYRRWRTRVAYTWYCMYSCVYISIQVHCSDHQRLYIPNCKDSVWSSAITQASCHAFMIMLQRAHERSNSCESRAHRWPAHNTKRVVIVIEERPDLKKASMIICMPALRTKLSCLSACICKRSLICKYAPEFPFNMVSRFLG